MWGFYLMTEKKGVKPDICIMQNLISKKSQKLCYIGLSFIFGNNKMKLLWYGQNEKGMNREGLKGSAI